MKKKITVKLQLKKETLREMADRDLEKVAGQGSGGVTCSFSDEGSCYTWQCC